jgi:hypothetical protein
LSQEEKAELQKRFPPEPEQQQGPNPQELAMIEKMKMDLEQQNLKTQQEALKVEKAALEIEKMKGEMGIMLGNFQVDLINKIEERLNRLGGGNQPSVSGGNGGNQPPQTPDRMPVSPGMSNPLAMGKMGPGGGAEAVGMPPQGGGGGVSGLMPIPGRAKGGPIDEGMPYVVGEQGPEVIVPREDGMVLASGRMPMVSPSPESRGGRTPMVNPEGKALNDPNPPVISPETLDHFQRMYGVGMNDLPGTDPRVKEFWDMWRVMQENPENQE